MINEEVFLPVGYFTKANFLSNVEFLKSQSFIEISLISPSKFMNVLLTSVTVAYPNVLLSNINLLTCNIVVIFPCKLNSTLSATFEVFRNKILLIVNV